jgi:hypothetical protein
MDDLSAINDREGEGRNEGGLASVGEKAALLPYEAPHSAQKARFVWFSSIKNNDARLLLHLSQFILSLPFFIFDLFVI